MEDHTPPSGDEEVRVSLTRRRKERHRAVPFLPEVRHFHATGLEVREQADTNEIVVSGSPIAYETWYEVMDMFGPFQERMMPGVAADVLPVADVRFLFNHDGLPLARTTARTMVLTDTPNMLTFEARLDARQQLANDLAIAIERGDITQMSCGFIVAEDKWDDDMESRTIFRFADLLDVSAVTYPASPTTSIQVAHRMVEQMPVESRERVRKVYAALRAGKVLSSANESKLAAAHEAIAAVLNAASPKASDDGDDRGEVVRHAADGDITPVETNPDATLGGNAPGDSSSGSQGVQDATGSRSDESDAEVRDDVSVSPPAADSDKPEEPKISRGSGMRFMLEARKRRRSL